MGANGSTIGILEGGLLKEIRTAAFDVPIVDSTGCGDTYKAGFIKGLSLGWDLENCAWLGCACGGLVIQGQALMQGIEGFEGTVEFAKKTGGDPLQIDDHLETKPINIVGMPTEALSLHSPLAEQAPCDHQ